jgi:hypothetical protein
MDLVSEIFFLILFLDFKKNHLATFAGPFAKLVAFGIVRVLKWKLDGTGDWLKSVLVVVLIRLAKSVQLIGGTVV